MASHRSSTKALLRRLTAADQPIYVLDQRRRVIFCNAAAEAWLGVKLAQLYGARCDYHSQPQEDKLAQIAAGLCPPPEVLQGQQICGHVTAFGEHGLRRRQARFLPLSGNDSPCTAVLAIIDVQDIEDPSTSPPTSAMGELDAHLTEHEQLHARLAEFRRRLGKFYALDFLVGESPAIRRAQAQAELAALGWSRTLIVGPAGSERERLARAIHYSRRPHTDLAAQNAPGPLAPLDCSLLDPELLQTAIADFHRKTRQQQAEDCSTLLLLDVDQLSAQSQSELAGFLRLPGFDLHIIATSQAPLCTMAFQGRRNDALDGLGRPSYGDGPKREGVRPSHPAPGETTFRSDLALALSTLVIELAPLASRKEDVPLAAQLLVEEANAEGQQQFSGFTPDALDRLVAYGWPGDMVQLRETVRESCGRATPPSIQVSDLPQQIHVADSAAAYPPRVEETIVLDEFLAQIEEELIKRALERSGGNKSRAARLLGVTRARLHRRLAQFVGGQSKPQAQTTPPSELGPEIDDDDPIIFEEA